MCFKKKPEKKIEPDYSSLCPYKIEPERNYLSKEQLDEIRKESNKK